MTGNCVATLSNQSIGKYFLTVIQDATGGRTLTLPSGYWSGGVEYTPTSASGAKDKLCIEYDGSAFWYSVVGLNYSIPV